MAQRQPQPMTAQTSSQVGSSAPPMSTILPGPGALVGGGFGLGQRVPYPVSELIDHRMLPLSRSACKRRMKSANIVS
jgi:hypothetical protein